MESAVAVIVRDCAVLSAAGLRSWWKPGGQQDGGGEQAAVAMAAEAPVVARAANQRAAGRAAVAPWRRQRRLIHRYFMADTYELHT
jgi:hypothetical protein